MIRLLPADAAGSVMRAAAPRRLGITLVGRRADREAARLIAADDAELERIGVRRDLSDTQERNAAIERVEAAIGADETTEALRESEHLQIGRRPLSPSRCFRGETASGE